MARKRIFTQPREQRRRGLGCLGNLLVLVVLLAAIALFDVRRRPLPAARTGATAAPLVPAPGTEPPRLLKPEDFRYRALFDAAVRQAYERTPRTDGQWAYDRGTAVAWAAPLGYLLAAETGGAVYLTETQALLDRQVALLAKPDLADAPELTYGAFGLVAGVHAGRPERIELYRTALRHYLDRAAILAAIDRYYVSLFDLSLPGDEQGPTTRTCQIAQTLLAGADVLDAPRPFFDYATVGLRMVDTIIAQCWDDSGGFVRAAPDDPVRRLLPNAMTIMCLVQAHRLTGEEEYLVRAQTIARTLGELRDAERGGYYAPADYQGVAGVLDYKSLESNLYAAKAFTMLYRATGDALYLDRTDAIFSFVERDLTADGIAYDHWFEGRRAAGDVYDTADQFRLALFLYELNAAVAAVAPQGQHTAAPAGLGVVGEDE